MDQAMKLWSPTADAVEASALTAFRRQAETLAGRRLATYRDLHRWSIEQRGAFWSLLWEFCGVVGERGDRMLVDGDRMPGARFFPEARLNFAENLLKSSGPAEAIVYRSGD